MATNRDVATRFASVIQHKLTMQNSTFPVPLARPLKGSNFMAHCNEHRHKQLRDATQDQFIALVQAISYRTHVAEIVWNNHTKMPELWLDPQGYSDSTKRQVRYATDAFIQNMRECGFADTYEQAHDQIFMTKAMQTATCCRVIDTLEQEIMHKPIRREIDHYMRIIDEPRRHEHTRHHALAAALRTAQYGLRLLSDGVPKDYPLGISKTAELRTDLQNFIDMFTNLSHIKDTAELRLAMRGIQALERN